MNFRRLLPLIVVLLAGALPAEAAKRVTLCHRPPGDPDHPHSIAVGEAAVRAHLDHGDSLGDCPPGCATSCDDGNPCTADSCAGDGTCVHGAASCDDGVPCTLDLCDPAAGCLALPVDGLACDDGNGCTSADRCAAGSCVGDAVAGCCASDAECQDGDPCTEDTCFLGACRNLARSCAVADKCLAGYCDVAAGGACATTEVSCDDGNVCTDDWCDPVIGCGHGPTATPPEAVEISCADGADNDCDGAVDGADGDCPTCGDGVVQPTEECDDGNENPYDGCDLCQLVDLTPD